jgi:microcystin-dependent protein
VARVRLPILVTSSKLLAIDDGDIVNGGVSSPYIEDPQNGSVLDVVDGATLTFAKRGGGSVTVYAAETGTLTKTGEELATDGRGRFEGWIERSSIVVTASWSNQEFTEHFDLAPAGDGTVDADWIASSAVTTAKIANSAVTSDKINNGAVGLDKISTSAKENVAAGTAGLRKLGTSGTDACAGNDSRLSNSRTPTGTAGGGLSGTYPNPSIGSGAISDANVATGANISEGKLNLSSDADPSVASRRSLGTTSNKAAAGNDSRFPTADEKAALAGPTGSAPSSSNRFVTQNSLTNQLTTDEKAALTGTSGTPSTTNKFVTNNDSRLPTTNQKSALAGALDTGSAPSAANPYVTDDDERFTYMIGDDDVTNAQLAGGITGDKLANSTVPTSKLASDVIQQLVPVGTILPYGGATAPSGYVVCDGSWLSTTTYPNLFQALGGVNNPFGPGLSLPAGAAGSGYSAGFGSGATFKVPDLRGRFPLGLGGSIPNNSSAANRGHAGGNALIAETNLPAHKHGVYAVQSANTTATGSSNRLTFVADAPGSGVDDGLSGSTGSGQGYLQPYITINYIIKA